jgi:hypothetical protein
MGDEKIEDFEYMKSEEIARTSHYNFFGGRKKRRVNPHERILKPTKRKTKVKGKEYTHYVICTSVPEEWKDGVKITIQSLKDLYREEYVDAAEHRMEMRDLNEQGEDFHRWVEEHFKQEDARFKTDEDWLFLYSQEWLQMSKEEKELWLKEHKAMFKDEK